MTSWQTWARLAVAIVGIGCAVLVYVGLKERQQPAEAMSGGRLDPKAVLASTGGRLQNFSGAREDFLVDFESSVLWDDGTTELSEVRITKESRDGRDFVVSARKGRSGKDDRDLELSQGVTLRDSTGLEVVTDRGVFNRDSGTLRVDGPVSFSRGRMTGSGVGMTYDEKGDVLTLARQAQVALREEEGAAGMSFTSGSATLDRRQNVLRLDGGVHAVQDTEVTDADSAVAQLSADEDVVTFVQLRGRANVVGGTTALSSMRANDIDLDYSEDGQRLETAVLTGAAAIALKGTGGSAGREFSGNRLDVAVAGDGSVTKLLGEGAVRMVLPPARDMPARTIEARTFEAHGAEGGTISDARFTDDVVFREDARGDGASRAARSSTLALKLSSDAVSSAVFRGGATFEEGDLQARAAEASYEPAAGSLRLTGADPRGRPHVADRRVTIDADSIDVVLDSRRIEAAGTVKTSLRADKAARSGGAGGAPTANRAGTTLPGLFAQDEPAFVTADRTLSYDGSKGTARYVGRVRLWQGSTEIRADAIDIYQETGDLIATGSARSSLSLDSKRSDGQAHEIRYTEASRLVTYTARAAGAPDGGGTPATAHVSGSQGDLRAADRIEVFLAKEESKVERVEAYKAVTAAVDADTTMKGNRLTYLADADRYDVTGTLSAPAVAEVSCRAFPGSTLTFSRSTDTMKVDGVQRFRTQTKRKSPC